jgi:hypothetical protein
MGMSDVIQKLFMSQIRGCARNFKSFMCRSLLPVSLSVPQAMLHELLHAYKMPS